MARAGVAGFRVTRVRRVRFLYLSQDLIVKSFLLIGAALAAASVSFSAVAGPDFYIIEKGRDAKRAVQRAEAAQAAQASQAVPAPQAAPATQPP